MYQRNAEFSCIIFNSPGNTSMDFVIKKKYYFY